MSLDAPVVLATVRLLAMMHSPQLGAGATAMPKLHTGLCTSWICHKLYLASRALSIWTCAMALIASCHHSPPADIMQV